jgi:DNA-binding PadR family transcriptional regulator
MPKLTNTSYAILGLLGLQPHTPYELAQQMSRSGIYWSAAQSVVYDEPKKLEAMGLATSSTKANGRRNRTIYTITAKGRRELAKWVREPGDGPQVQFEAMLKVLFADAGTVEDLRGSIDAVRAWAEQSQRNAKQISRDYLDGTAPYPDRAHIVTLTMAYQWEFVAAALRWAEFADRTIADWESTDRHDDPDLSLFERIVDDSAVGSETPGPASR